MELFRLLLVFRDGKNLQFCYKGNVTAEAAYALLTQPTMMRVSPDPMPRDAQIGVTYDLGGKIERILTPVGITDDYGNKAMIDVSALTAVVMTNVNDDLHAQTDLQIVQAHNEIYKETKMQKDPQVAEYMKKMAARAHLAAMNGGRAM